MTNGLRNAGFLDGAEGWSAVGGSLSVDEATQGAPGLAVLAVAGTTTGADQTVGVLSDSDNGLTVTAGDVVEAYGQWWSSVAGAALAVAWYDVDGSFVSASTVPQASAAPTAGGPQYGARATLNRSYGQLTAPSGAVKGRLGLEAAIPGASTPWTMALLKPWLQVPGAVVPARWDPGTHENADLAAVPAFPGLPAFQDSSTAAPFPAIDDFTGDDGIPTAGRVTADVQQQFQGNVRLTQLQFAQLMAFFRDTAGQFFIVRPDTDELSFATWLKGGEPKVTSMSGGWLIVQVGLKLRNA